MIVFDNAFHGRTLLTMTMTSKVVPYKQGFGPFAPEVYRAPAPYPYRGVTDGRRDRRRSSSSSRATSTRTSVACAVLEPVQGEGGFIPMPPDFPTRLQELLDQHGILYVDDEVQSGCGRTGPVWAIEHYGVEPDLLVSGKSLGGGLPLAAVTGRAEVMDAVAPGRARRHVRRQPARLRRGARDPRRVSAPSSARAPSSSASALRDAARRDRGAHAGVGEVRGLGPMLAIELARAERRTAHAGRHRGRARAGAASSSPAASTAT